MDDEAHGPEDDEAVMQRAVALAAAVRASTSPNPWVGCVLTAADGTTAPLRELDYQGQPAG